MMRFRCPHCQQVLEVETPTEMMLCPACEMWCRLPIAQAYKPNQEATIPFDEPRLAPSNPEPFPGVSSNGFTSRRTEEVPLRFLDEREDVQFEIIQEGEPRRHKRRRRRRRSRFGFDLDYWVSPSLILFILIVPCGIFIVMISFLIHPGAGIGAFLFVGASIWLAFLAVEDGLATALMVVFVPFYTWYYAVSNFERIAVPFALRCLGGIVFIVCLVTSSLQAADRRSGIPPRLDGTTLIAGRITFSPFPRSAAAAVREPSSCPASPAATPEA